MDQFLSGVFSLATDPYTNQFVQMFFAVLTLAIAWTWAPQILQTVPGLNRDTAGFTAVRTVLSLAIIAGAVYAAVMTTGMLIAPQPLPFRF